MKKLLSIILLITANINMNSQTADFKKAKDATYMDSNYAFAYLVGSVEGTEYELKVHNYPNETKVKSFKNGRSAPILQVYVTNKLDYTGGVLENEKGVKTIIKNITLEESGETLIFTVIGKEFSMSFSLVSGVILKEEKGITVFYTEKVGAWKINKK